MLHSTPRPLRARRLATLALTGLLAAANPAHAEGQHTVSIPSGPLDAALLALAAQTHEQLLYPPEIATGRRVAALKGDYTAEQALSRLLAGADITVTRAGPAVLVLRAASAAAAPTAAHVQPASEVQRPARPFGAESGPRATAPAETATPPERPADPARAAPATVSEVQVTGTHIRGADAGASPLAVIDRLDLQRSGQMTVAEALSVLPQNFNGQDTEITAVTFADNRGVNSAYGTGVNLRGLGADATLTLIDGRRLGGAGAKGDFTDISTIPSVAVARVEVLLDGASAIYGSDAVGGVVNVLLRHDLDGGEVRVESGVGAGSTPKESQAGLIWGHTWPGGGITAAYETYHRTALQAAHRAFTASTDLRPLGGSDFRNGFAHPGNIQAVNPATGALAPFWAIPTGQNGVGLTAASFHPNTVNLGNSHEAITILPDQERDSLYLAARQALGAHVELTGEAIYGFRRARLQSTPPAASFTVTTADPFFVSPNGVTSESILYKFSGELPPPIARNTAETLAVTLGAKIDLPGGWRSDSFLDVSQEIEEGRTHGAVNTTLLAEALGNVPDRTTTAYSPARDGFFNPFTGVAGANSPAVLKAIGSGFVISRRESRIYTVSSQADGTLLDLPGGPLKLAVGGQARHETFTRFGTNYTSTVAPVAQASTDVQRTVGALFGELRAPLVGPDNPRRGIQRLEVSAAARWEHYNDFGSTWNPKVGVLWSPAADLNLRATYGASFRAPGLRELDDPALNTPAHIGAGVNTVLALVLTGGNPGLRPETADTWTAGLDWRPAAAPGLRVSATWFDVRYRNRIDTPVTSSLATALNDPTYASFVQHLNTANPADLAVISALLADPHTTTSQGIFPASAYGAVLDTRYVNTGALRVQGLDLTASYGFDVAQGRLDLNGNLSDLLTYDQALTPTSARVDRKGQVGFPARFRGRLTADWTRGALSLGAAVNQTSGFHDTIGARVNALTTTDLQLRWVGPAGSRWAGLTLALTARNVFDKAPPFYNNPLGYAFDPTTADIIGRFVSAQLTKSW